MLGAFANGAFRGNLAFLGLPLLTNIAGPAGTQRAAVLITFVVPIYNVCSVLVLAKCAPSAKKITTAGLAVSIIKNPFIISIFVAAALSIAPIGMPAAVDQTINHLAGTATPLALICLGGGIVFKFDAKFAAALAASLVKTALLPVLHVGIALWLGFRGVDLVALMVLGGIPSAIAGYAMATQMGADEQTAGGIVFISTALSAFFLTLGVFALRAAGLFV